MGNSFGDLFKLTSFGESHGVSIGGVIEGCLPNIKIDFSLIQSELNRRKPGQSNITTQRKEEDIVEFQSGFIGGITTGMPIGFIIKNLDQKSKDYSHNIDVYRPSHADFTYYKKFGIRDHRGGGRSSARETSVRIVAGAIAKQILLKLNISFHAFVSQVGSIKIESDYSNFDLSLNNIESNIVRCPVKEKTIEMQNLIERIKKNGDTIGGKITCIIKNTPIGIGEPVFDRLNAELAKAMFSINAVKGFELGSGFDCITMKGSEHNDEFYVEKEVIKTKTNYSGGIQGGISNGEDIYFNVAFKPVATIIQKQNTINLNNENVEIMGKGRHDPCVVPRAVPIVEAMAAMVILDYYLKQKCKSL